MRKIILEGHRFSSKAAVEAGLVDVAAPGEGAAGTLEAAREMANKVKGKASMDAYGSNKVSRRPSTLEISTVAQIVQRD